MGAGALQVIVGVFAVAGVEGSAPITTCADELRFCAAELPLDTGTIYAPWTVNVPAALLVITLLLIVPNAGLESVHCVLAVTSCDEPSLISRVAVTVIGLPTVTLAGVAVTDSWVGVTWAD